MRIGTPGFIGERLASARQARGLTASSLAELVGIHAANIHNYEHDKQSPSPRVLRTLSDTLKVPQAFFLKAMPKLGAGRLFYRSLSSATKAARSKGERRFEWLKEIVSYLGEYIDFPELNVPAFNIPDDIAAITVEQIEEIASECRQFWSLGNGPVSDVVMTLENNGVFVARTSLDAEKLDAFSQWDDMLSAPFVVLSSDKASAVRSRFDAAHELGHLVLHRKVDDRQLRTPRLFSLIERQAHRFAGAFLLPEKEFLSEVWTPSIDAFRSLKGHWKAAIGLMIMRCHDLGVLSEDQAKRAWVNMSRRGWRKREPLDDELKPEVPVVLQHALKLLDAEGIKTKEQMVLELRLRPVDIESLVSAEPGFLSDERDSGPRPQLKAKNVVNFPTG